MMKKILLLFSLSLGFSCNSQQSSNKANENQKQDIKLFLAGDVMTGRGVDQALPYSVDPVLYESYVKDARDYLLLAERASGDIKTPLSYEYIWGDALKVWDEQNPDLKLVNLETSITTYDEPWPGKSINYRMHPENIEVLKIAGIDHVSLANNHTLDWRRPGLLETMKTLEDAEIAFSGVGLNAEEASEPSILNTERGRVLIYSYGSPTSGVPFAWAAENDLSGVNFLPDLSEETISEIKNEIEERSQPKDLVVFSVHWGANWGYDIAEDQRRFAHQLIDESGVDVVFGHSSHHPLGIEVYKNKLIIYGAGDFFNDYEGISGHEEFKGELTLMYFPIFNFETEGLVAMKMVPMKIEKLRLHRATAAESKWLEKVLSREGQKLGTTVRRDKENVLWLENLK